MVICRFHYTGFLMFSSRGFAIVESKINPLEEHMKSAYLILFLALVLTACGSTPQIEPTAKPTQETVPVVPSPPTEPPVVEVRLTSVESLVGIWKAQSGGYTVLHYFNADGTMKVYVSGVGDIGSGPYVFENSLLKLQDTTGDCEGIAATYEIYGIYENGQLTQLRFVLVGDDACADRRKTLDGRTLFPN